MLFSKNTRNNFFKNHLVTDEPPLIIKTIDWLQVTRLNKFSKRLVEVWQRNGRPTAFE